MSEKSENTSENTEALITSSPCIGICSTTFGDEICFGCKRTYEEVIQWNAMDDQQKDKINRRLIAQAKTEASAN